jgi:hypothetical protein
MLVQSVGDIIAPESQTLADFFALSEARLNDHGLTIDFRVNNPIDPICKIRASSFQNSISRSLRRRCRSWFGSRGRWMMWLM